MDSAGVDFCHAVCVVLQSEDSGFHAKMVAFVAADFSGGIVHHTRSGSDADYQLRCRGGGAERYAVHDLPHSHSGSRSDRSPRRQSSHIG